MPALVFQDFQPVTNGIAILTVRTMKVYGIDLDQYFRLEEAIKRYLVEIIVFMADNIIILIKQLIKYIIIY